MATGDLVAACLTVTMEAPPAVPGAAATFRTAAEIQERGEEHSDLPALSAVTCTGVSPTWCFGSSSQWTSRYGGSGGGHQRDSLISWCHGGGGGVLGRAGYRCGGGDGVRGRRGGSRCSRNVVLLQLQQVGVGGL